MCSTTSHHDTGQFWNIPIDVEAYDGPVPSYLLEEELYTITVNPAVFPPRPRSFVAELNQQTWDTTADPCFFAGNYQGGAIYEITDPGGTVIEGSFRDYRVDSLFSTDFVYSQFGSNQCV